MRAFEVHKMDQNCQGLLPFSVHFLLIKLGFLISDKDLIEDYSDDQEELPILLLTVKAKMGQHQIVHQVPMEAILQTNCKL